MKRLSTMLSPRCSFQRWLTGALVAGLVGALGCTQTGSRTATQPATALPRATLLAPVTDDIQLAQHSELPAPSAVAAVPVQSDKVLPINLDTVLRLANDQNGQIQLAREQVNEAFAGKALAEKAWLPDVYVGLSYFRHEGGIQDETGQMIHSSYGSLFAGMELGGRLDLREAVFRKIDAERKLLQQKGELARLNSEMTLDAATTYVDLLAAKTGEAISRDMEAKLSKVLDQAKKLAATEKGVQVEVYRVEAQLAAQQQITREVQAGARNAGAKLLQLLNLDAQAQLVVTDPKLVAFPLIPALVPAPELVEHALTNGPGVRELEGILNLIQRADCEARGPGQYLPVFEVRMAEGAFGAGPGANADWDNRWDLALQARWNLTNLCTAKERQWSAQSKKQQVHLSYQNLRSKLTLGVQEAVETSANNAEQIRLAEKQIDNAREAFKLSESRLNNNIPGASPSEVLLAIRTLGGAQLSYLNALRDFDKAQLRLLILTGRGPTAGPQ